MSACRRRIDQFQGEERVYTPGQPYKGSMISTGSNDELLPQKPTRQCVSCFKEYDRTKTNLHNLALRTSLENAPLIQHVYNLSV